MLSLVTCREHPAPLSKQAQAVRIKKNALFIFISYWKYANTGHSQADKCQLPQKNLPPAPS